MSKLDRAGPDLQWVHPRGLPDKVQTATKAKWYAGMCRKGRRKESNWWEIVWDV